MSGKSLTVTVLGSGTMGQGIAQVTAQSGHTTRVYDAAEGRAGAAIQGISGQLEKLVGKGKITADARQATLSKLAKNSFEASFIPDDDKARLIAEVEAYEAAL